MAGNKINIEIPFKANVKGGGKKIGETIAEQIKKSLKSVGIGKSTEGKGDSKILTNILGVVSAGTAGILALLGLLKPVMNLFKAILILLFWPLIPILKPVLESLGEFAKKMKEQGGGITGAIAAAAQPTKMQISLGAKENENIATAFAGALVIAIGVAIAAASVIAGVSIVPGFVIALSGALILFVPQIAEGIVSSIGTFWSSILSIAMIAIPTIILFAMGGWILALVGLLTAAVIAFLPELKKFGSWLWEKITTFIDSGMDKLKGIGSWIWDKITGFFGGGKNSRSVGDAIITPQGVVHTNPNDFIIATKDPSKLGGKGITININNPSVRNDMDIKKIADQVSMVLQRKTSGRFM